MATDAGFENAAALLKGARDARVNMVVFAHDAQVPSEVAPLSRFLWRHVPELARRMDPGLSLGEDEGHPRGLVATDQGLLNIIARDMTESRGVADWLSMITSDATKSMFAKGADNAMDGIMQRFADDRGVVREDSIAAEAGRVSQPAPQEQLRPTAAIVASIQAQRSRG